MSEAGRVQAILETLQLEYPQAGTRLNFNSTFELLVAVILSAQSTDDQVNRVTGELFQKYRSLEDFASIELPELEELIRGVGLYRAKARNIKKTATLIRDKYNGEIPRDFNQLLQLPGVGRKTANVVLSVGLRLPGLGVDTHVLRVSNRLGLVQEKNPDRAEKTLKSLIPREHWGRAHHLFIFHGRKICRARKAECEDCVLAELCPKILN